jgi:hypothetical protein
MRFMLTIQPDSRNPNQPPDPRLMAAVAKLSDEMTKAGILLDTGGIQARGTVLRAAGGKLSATDGPFPETKELIAGFAIVDVKSREEAIELGSRFMRLHQEILGPTWEGESDVRQMFGSGDFKPEAGQ